MLAPTPCADPQCHATAVREGRCQDHQRPRWQGTTRKQRLPKDWTTRRLVVLKRDKGVCYLCGQPGADRVDHIVPGDNHSLTNLAAVHDAVEPHCHRYKSSQEGHEAQQGNRVRRRH
jgi:5-methylcytosine-specific restriction protein A